MPRARRDETPSGRWSVGTGKRPHTVRVMEEPGRVGENVVLRYRTRPGEPYTTETLGFPVRDEKGRISPEAVRRAKDAGERKSRELGLGILREETAPRPFTVGQAFALFLDDREGGLPASESARRNYIAASRAWENLLGADTPWNAILRNRVSAYARRVKEEEGLPEKAIMHVKVLRRVHNWLENEAGIEDLKDPTKTFRWKEARKGHKPRQERYSAAEVAALRAVRYRVSDPRFALMFTIAEQWGARSTAIRLTWRSGLDRPQNPDPTPGDAPLGWLELAPLKGQDEPLFPLTLRARLEIVRAIWKRWDGSKWVPGPLAEYEARYQAHGIDYPLVPGGKLVGGKVKVRTPAKPISANDAKEWLREAEALADVDHVEHRLWHGLRREWTDRVEEEAGLDVVAVAGAWADRSLPEKTYRKKKQYGKLARAREVLERANAEDL